MSLCGRRLWIATILVVSCAAALAAPQSQPVPPPSPNEQLAQRRKTVKELADFLPLLPTHHFADVFRFTSSRGRLEWQTSLEPEPRYRPRYARPDGFDGLLTMIYMKPAGAPAKPPQLNITIDCFPKPEQFCRMHVSAAADGIAVHSLTDTKEGNLEVSFNQAAQSAVLSVRSQDPQKRLVAGFKLEEPDFARLCQKHPAEVSQYLRPMFRLIGQDSAFTPDAETAWQVLWEDWPRDPGIEAKVRQEVALLNSDERSVRSAAAERLAALGLAGATAILRLDRAALDAEQNLRLDGVIARFIRMPKDESRRLRDDRAFLSDCLNSDDPTVRQIAADRLARLSAPKPPHLDTAGSR